jgi:hypothetical protein
MKKKLLGTILAILLLPVCANATTMDFYTDGTITDNNVFDTVNVWDTATVDMSGGNVVTSIIHDTATLNYTSGEIQFIITYGNSTVNVNSDYSTDFQLEDNSKVFLYNGSSNFQAFLIDNPQIAGNPQVHIYGYNFVYTPYHPDMIFLDGYWENNQNFHFIIRLAQGTSPQNSIFLHEIPEPSTLSLLGLLILFMRKRDK